MRPTPLVLCILDGWGEQPPSPHNAIALAHTPVMDALKRDYPWTTINASELHVGLPSGQMGNSEVGHMNIGAGRVVMQDLPRIDAAIESGAFAADQHLANLIAAAKTSGGVAHLLGLVSDGGVHSHIHHITHLANTLCDAGVHVAIHAWLDGRDTPPKSAIGYLQALQRSLHPDASIVSISGRYYAMDRDKRFDRTEKAFLAMQDGRTERFDTPIAYVESQYAAGITDEFILPAVAKDYGGMKHGDVLLCANFRADRVRQMLGAFLDAEFEGFGRMRNVAFAAKLGLTSYSERLDGLMQVMFAPESLSDTLGEVLAREGLKQLRIAETEKYAHVTFFFNGGREELFAGEERIMIPSPKVATYDLQPEMSATQVADAIVDAVEKNAFDVIIVNFANTDMVGHTGDVEAAKCAVEAVDACVGKIADAVLTKGGAMLITADHGNAECMMDEDTKQPHTAHTLYLVPAIVVGEKYKGKTIAKTGALADIAPTLLAMLGITQPKAMTGKSLLHA